MGNVIARTTVVKRHESSVPLQIVKPIMTHARNIIKQYKIKIVIQTVFP